jgi:hypothetical protein
VESFNYSALLDPHSEMWVGSEYSPDEQRKIKTTLELLKMFKIMQPMPLLLATKIHYNKADFINLLRYIEVISMRYNVICNLPPNDQESFYKGLANKVSHDNYSVSQIKFELTKFYPNDDEFTNAFMYKDFKQTYRARYLLLKLQNALDNNLGTLHESDLTVEHLLPQKLTANWMTLFKSPESFIFKLANMALLPKNINRDLERKDFAEKKSVIVDTKLAINQMLTEFNDWTPENLTKRQKALAIQAKTIWWINF